MSEGRSGTPYPVRPKSGRRVSPALLASVRARSSALVFLAAIVSPPMLRQSQVGVANVLVPVIRLIQADATVGLQDAHPDSVLVNIGMLAGDIVSVPDSVQGLVPFEVSAHKYWDCNDGLTPGAVVSRARCALLAYQHYIEFRTIEVHDSTAEATILVARRSKTLARGRGARETIVSTLRKAVGKRSVPSMPVSFHTYVVRLTRTDNGDWIAGGIVTPLAANR